MPFTTRNNHHLPQPQAFSIGPTTGFLDNVESSFRRTREVESAYGFEVDLRDRWYENLKSAEVDLDRPFGLPFSELTPMVRRELGEDPYSNTWLSRERVNETLANFDRIDEEIKKRRKADPEGTKDLRTFKEIISEEKRKRAETIDETNLTGARSGFFGQVGSFIGGMAGSFDPARDPLLFSSLGIPVGASGHIARRMMLEGMIGGGVEVVQQTQLVQPQHRLLGEEEGNVLEAVLFATVGSAAFRGVAEGAAPAARAVERRVAPHRAGARIIAEQFEAATGRPLDFSRVKRQQSMSLDQLLNAVRSMPESPQRFAMEGLLTNEVLTRESSPHNISSKFGRVETEESVTIARQEFEGAPEPVATRTAEPTPAAKFGIETRAKDETLFIEPADRRSSLSLQIRPDALVVKGVAVDRRSRGTGIGTALYEEAVAEASRRGVPLRSDTTVSEEAARVYESLRKKGYEVRQNEGVQVERGSGLHAFDSPGKYVFEVLPKRQVETPAQGEGAPLKQSATDALRMSESFVPEEKVDEIFGNIREVKAEDAELADIDIGIGRTVREDFQVDTPEGVRSVREILDDLDDNEAMLVAAKECGI